MTLTIGISTTHQRYNIILEHLLGLPHHIHALMVVQGDDLPQALKDLKSDQVTIIHDPQRGLARSRNLVLDHCQTDYLLIADDDVAFDLEGITALATYLDQHPDCTAVTGQVRCPDGSLFKTYKTQAFQHGWRSLLGVCSIEIMVRMAAVKQARIRFDERFGLGAPYLVGEETVFLMDLYQHRCRIDYLPCVVAEHPAESSGEDINQDRTIGRGAGFYRMFGWRGFFLLPVYAWRQRRYSLNHDITVFCFFCWLLKGFFGFNKNHSNV